MTFKPTIPGATDKPSISQGDIQTNFTALNNSFNTDHITFNAQQDRGEHTKVTFNNVVADPNLADPKASLYTKTVDGDSQLFFENFDVGAANVIRQMTNIVPTTLAGNDPVDAANGTFSSNGLQTPFGVILNWGTFTVLQTRSTITISFAVAFNSAPTSVIAINFADSITAPVGVRDGANIPTTTTAQFRVNAFALANVTYYYFAIGV